MTSHNVPLVSSGYLRQVTDAFEAVHAGSVDYAISDGAREYPFRYFPIITRDE